MSRKALSWTIKESFREYVRSVPDGVETWHGRLPAFLFASADNSTIGRSTVLEVAKFVGAVKFSAYRGGLNVYVGDPWLERDGSILVVTVNIAERSPAVRIPLATAHITEASTRLLIEQNTQIRPALTESGAALFGNSYTAGTLLDPLLVMGDVRGGP